MFKRVFLVVSGMVISNSVLSAGFIIPESSVEGVAMSDAMVANTQLSGAFTYNYSSMLFSAEDQASMDLIGVSVDTSVSPLSPNLQNGKVKNRASDAVLPSAYLTQKISDEYSWGLHVGVPFGLETVWPADTFSHFQAADTAIGAGGAVAGLHPTKSSLELVALSPSIGKKVNNQFALALGIDYYHVINVEMNSVANRLSGDGSEAGWNLSLQYHVDKFSFGASYHSSVDIKINGDADIAGVGIVSASTSFALPDRLQIGAAYSLSDKLLVEMDVERIGWSEYGQLVLTSTGGAIPAGTVFSTTTSNWSDVTNLRLGFIYKLNDKTKLLFGSGYEEKAQGDDYFDATIADADRYMISFGGVHEIDKNWLIKAGYQYAWIDDRTVNGRDYINQLVASAGLNSDANGTDVYNGQYEGHIQMLSIGASRLF